MFLGGRLGTGCCVGWDAGSGGWLDGWAAGGGGWLLGWDAGGGGSEVVE